FLRGAICSVIAFIPFLVEWAFLPRTILQLILTIMALVLGGGLFYSLPSLRRIRSKSFVEHYKS
ncbi:MAG TPA: hypothetical protein VE177_05315, partial [Candidatus Binatus sp.]|nr:hypothetical protein [Candidatus Binatus sp.]